MRTILNLIMLLALCAGSVFAQEVPYSMESEPWPDGSKVTGLNGYTPVERPSVYRFASFFVENPQGGYSEASTSRQSAVVFSADDRTGQTTQRTHILTLLRSGTGGRTLSRIRKCSRLYLRGKDGSGRRYKLLIGKRGDYGHTVYHNVPDPDTGFLRSMPYHIRNRCQYR